jgi:hypothetical protein
MTIDIIYLFNIILLVRVFTQWTDEPIRSVKKNLALAAVELILAVPMMYSFSMALVLLLIFAIYHVAVWVTENRSKNLFWGRLLQIVLLFLIAGTLLGVTNHPVLFNGKIMNLLDRIRNANILTRDISDRILRLFMLYFFGVMITVMEVNHIVRAVLKSIKAAPVRNKDMPSEEGNEDTDELRRGKIIGAVERVLFFFFVLTGNYSSIGFILAAKGITRFKELDDKDFAEYVLIGTLLSSSLSIFCGELVKKLSSAL